MRLLSPVTYSADTEGAPIYSFLWWHNNLLVLVQFDRNGNSSSHSQLWHNKEVPMPPCEATNGISLRKQSALYGRYGPPCTSGRENHRKVSLVAPFDISLPQLPLPFSKLAAGQVFNNLWLNKR